MLHLFLLTTWWVSQRRVLPLHPRAASSLHMLYPNNRRACNVLRREVGQGNKTRMSTLLQKLPPLSLAPVVAKPPTINSRRQRPLPSTGQQAVFAFLKRKHESYLRRLSLLRDGALTEPVGRNTWDLPDRGEWTPFVGSRNTILC